MEKTMDCTIFEDLMSLYADELTQPETNRLMEEHLQSCTRCKARYEKMSKPIQITMHKGQDTSIDYLKSIRYRQRKRLLLSLLGLFTIMFLGVVLKLFVLGTPTTAQNLLYQRAGDRLHIQGEYTGSAEVLTRHTLKDRGDYYEVTLYAGLASVLHRDARIDIQVPLDKPVHLHGDIIRMDGFVIQKFTQDVYETKHAYIGDASKNLELLHVLGIQRLSPFTMELKTTQKPYEFIIHTTLTAPPEKRIKQQMVDYGTVILSLIDNCEVVSWTFDSTGQEAVQVDLMHATEALGASPKDYSHDVADLQLLLNKLGIHP